MTINQRYKLSIVPDPDLDIVQVALSQYDKNSRTIYFELFNDRDKTVAYNIPTGSTVTIRGTKPDETGFEYECNYTGNTVSALIVQQMTVISGIYPVEIRIAKDDEILASATMMFNVKDSALQDDTETSETDLPLLEKASEAYSMSKESMDAAAKSAEAAAKSEKNAKTSETNSKNSETNAKKSEENASASATAAKKSEDNAMKATPEGYDALVTAVDTKFDGAYSENGIMYFTSGGNIICQAEVGQGKGGSGGGNEDVTMKIKNTTGWNSTTLAGDTPCVVTFNWSSLEDGSPTGDGNLVVRVNNAQRLNKSIAQGDQSLDLTSYLNDGNNSIRITVTDTYGTSRQLVFSISKVVAQITSNFDASAPFTDAISFTYTPIGNIQKTVHFLIDGKEIGTTETSVSGRQLSYEIPKQRHGSHKLTAYFTCTINDQTVQSNQLYYDLICLEAGDNTPVIASNFDQTSVPQYSTVHLNYRVYDPANLQADVKISVNGTQEASLTVDRTEQTFSYRADKTGDLTIRIETGDVSMSFIMQVTKTDINVQAESEGLALHLTAQGRSNAEEHPESWTDGDISAKLTGFNFTSDGWQTDADGNSMLRVSGDDRVVIPYKPFASDFRSTGKTIEIEFATHYVRNYDTPIISCMSGDRGIELTAQLAKLKSEQSELDMQYKEDEHVRVSFVVNKRAENRLMEVYVNGIMSGAVQYPESDDFSQVSPVDISIGSNDCATDIYCIRVYDQNLTRVQMLNNWIADTQNIDQLIDRYNRNNIYDEYGNVVISKLPSDLPYMIITCPELPQYKGDKKTVEVSYTDPVNASKSFTATNVQADVQGTSSQYYRRKNYKLKFRSGFEMTEDSTHEDKYALRSGSIPESTFCMKADVASSEGANNVELVRLYNDACPYKTPAQKKNPAVRQGIDGFPCVIFWNDGNNTTFLGKYNFNNDKSDEKTFGFVEGDESWETLNNTSQRVLWKSDDYESTVTDESGNVVPAWLNDFEARYPDEDPAYTDSTQLKALATFIKSTDRTQATNEALASPVTYDGVEYTTDSADYRLAKFKAEVGNYIELQSAEFYYLFTELFLMVDSRAKNMFPSFMGSEVK